MVLKIHIKIVKLLEFYLMKRRADFSKSCRASRKVRSIDWTSVRSRRFGRWA